MNSRLLLVAAAAIAVSTGAHAADLIVDATPMTDVAASDYSVYVQVLGGAALPGVVSYNGEIDFDTDAGYGLGASAGVEVLKGLAIEADLLHLRRTFTGFDFYDLSTTSLMANVKGSVALNDMFSIYAAVGVGAIYLLETSDVSGTNDSFGAGYQLIAGASAEVAQNISVVGEFRYQDTFEAPLNDDGDAVSAPTAAFLAGVKLSF